MKGGLCVKHGAKVKQCAAKKDVLKEVECVIGMKQREHAAMQIQMELSAGGIRQRSVDAAKKHAQTDLG